MFNNGRTIQRPKSRFSKVRGVFLLMVAFIVYFSLAKPAVASSHSNKLSVVSSALAQQIVAEVQDEYAFDDSRPLSCSDCGGEENDGDSSDLDIDEFIATLPHLDVLTHIVQYAVEDMRLSLPPFGLSLEYPPDAQV